ncbi:hypothetical protein AB1Y20_005959 [Prymnesium parvum]|uniref:Thioredoxin n=1 Tax=Prymnesium parvum TaxID=97485 RepID=A0AB34J2Q1_PRYPA
MSVRWDNYSQVRQAMLASTPRGAVPDPTPSAPRLLVVAFIDQSSPPALATAATLESIRSAREVDGFAQLFLLEASAEAARAAELGLVSTPALAFYWDARPLIVRRPDWADGALLVGPLPHATLLEVMRHARECCIGAAGGELVLSLDF